VSETITQVLLWLMLFPLTLWGVFTALNTVLFWYIRDYAWLPLESVLKNRATALPKVSLLIPARNEAANLPTLLPSLVAQDYPNLEIIVLSDHSTDNTLAIAQSFAAKYQHLRVIEGAELLDGWMGKQNACRQLLKEASGDILCFSDADTEWQPDAISLIVKSLHHRQLDALSVWPEQLTVGLWGALLQPFMAWSLLALLPAPLIPNPRFPGVVSANGQCLCFYRTALASIGGFEQAKTAILDDMALARAVKHRGLRFGLLLGRHTIRCKMYNNNRETFDGFAKAAFLNFNANPWALVAVVLVFCWFFIGPWLWLVAAIATGGTWWWALLTVVAASGGRAISDAVFGFPQTFGVLQGPSALAWCVMALSSWQRYASGKIAWKGRVYDLRDKK
jgi:chlorobactene glucosyltransferase